MTLALRTPRTDQDHHGVSGALKLWDIDTPPDSRFFGKPIKAEATIAEMQQMIRHAWRRRHQAEKGDSRSIVPETTSQLI